MIKINSQNKHHRRWIVIAITAVVVLAAAGLLIFFLNRGGQKPAAETSTPATTSATSQQGTAAPAKGTVTEQPAAPTGGSVDVQLTASSQAASAYQLRFQIDTVSNNGQCTLVLSIGTATITKTASVQALARTSTCQGFDIPLDELKTGTWNFTLTYANSDDNLNGSLTGTFDVK